MDRELEGQNPELEARLVFWPWPPPLSQSQLYDISAYSALAAIHTFCSVGGSGPEKVSSGKALSGEAHSIESLSGRGLSGRVLSERVLSGRVLSGEAHLGDGLSGRALSGEALSGEVLSGEMLSGEVLPGRVSSERTLSLGSFIVGIGIGCVSVQGGLADCRAVDAQETLDE